MSIDARVALRSARCAAAADQTKGPFQGHNMIRVKNIMKDRFSRESIVT